MDTDDVLPLILLVIIVVGFGGIFFGIHQEAVTTININAKIVKSHVYDGDNAPYRILTVQTPNGLKNITVSCNFYNVNSTIPLSNQQPYWWIVPVGGRTDFYGSNLQAGC